MNLIDTVNNVIYYSIYNTPTIFISVYTTTPHRFCSKKYTNLVTKTKSAGTMALIITKTLTHVGLRGANYFYLQPHHAVIIRTGNTYTRSSSVSRVPPRVARDSMGAELFKNTVLY